MEGWLLPDALVWIDALLVAEDEQSLTLIQRRASPSSSMAAEDGTVLVRSAPAAPAAPVPRSPFTARLDDGTSLVVDCRVVVGRDPVAAPGAMDVRLVPVGDHTRSVSKTHMELWPIPDGIMVRDRSSTNGTVLVAPDGIETPLVPGGESVVDSGWTVRFGDRTLQVGPS
jgi:hypothetical protein